MGIKIITEEVPFSRPLKIRRAFWRHYNEVPREAGLPEVRYIIATVGQPLQFYKAQALYSPLFE